MALFMNAVRKIIEKATLSLLYSIRGLNRAVRANKGYSYFCDDLIGQRKIARKKDWPRELKNERGKLVELSACYCY